MMENTVVRMIDGAMIGTLIRHAIAQLLAPSSLAAS
jgi:hypothetical protein